MEGQAGLAAAAGAKQGDQARLPIAQPGSQLSQLVFTPDEGGERHGQLAGHAGQAALRRLFRQDAPVELLCLLRRLDVQLLIEQFAEAFVARQRLSALPVQCQQAHQTALGGLVERIYLHPALRGF